MSDALPGTDDGPLFEPDRTYDQGSPKKTPSPTVSAEESSPELLDSEASGLVRIVRWHPAINYFGYVANRMMPSEWSAQMRFSQFARNHPYWFKVSFYFDWMLTATAGVGAVVVVFLAAVKALWPIFS